MERRIFIFFTVDKCSILPYFDRTLPLVVSFLFSLVPFLLFSFVFECA